MRSMERTIIHLNVADFAVAVERLSDQRLRDRPVVIAPQGTSRCAVFDMSDEAYAAGVRKGMLLSQASRLCKDASILPPHPNRYDQAMQAVLKQTLLFSPLIEAGQGDGHLFMDMTGTSRLFGPSIDVAWRLFKQIKKDVGLSPIWSVASNKLVAKVASRLVKPIGEYIVGAGEEQAFLAPLPIYLIPGVDSKDLTCFYEFNLRRISEVTAWNLFQLEVLFGKRAQFIHDVVRGIDTSPVLPVGRKLPVVSVDHEFGTDTNDMQELERVLYHLVEKAGFELRRQNRCAGTIGITLDYSDGMRKIRQAKCQPPTANDWMLFSVASKILHSWTRRVRIRYIRLVYDNLVFPPAQLELFASDRHEKERRRLLLNTVDTIRQRFGSNAIHIGRAIAA